MSKGHRDLPAGSQPWANEVDKSLSEVKELRAIVRRLTENAGIDMSNPSRGINTGDTPNAKNPVGQKISSLADVDSYNVLDGQVLTWDQREQKWLPKTKRGGGKPVVNLFPDPNFRTKGDECVLAYNYFQNPSPVSDLNGFTAVGGATLTLDPSVSIKGQGGLTVVSPDATSGLRLHDFPDLFGVENPESPYVNHRLTITGYVRAHSAMTLTLSCTSPWTMGTWMGWGEFGWGIPFSYQATASYTLAAGEVKKFRIQGYVYTGSDPSVTYPGSPTPLDINFSVLGEGSFDVDSVGQYDYVHDGIDVEYFPQYAGRPGDPDDYYGIPGAPIYFDGNTQSTPDGIFYEWAGEPNNSISIQKAYRAKYLRTYRSIGQWDFYQNHYVSQLPGGEPAVAIQAPWNYADNGSYTSFFVDGEEDVKRFGLEEGKAYAMSAEVVNVDEAYFSAYPDGTWASQFLIARDGGYSTDETDIWGHAPYRERPEVAFIPGSDNMDVYYHAGWGWQTGRNFLTNVMLTEIDFVMIEFLSTRDTVAADGFWTKDLLALGLERGQRYKLKTDADIITAGDFAVFEYQCGDASSNWWPLARFGFEDHPPTPAGMPGGDYRYYQYYDFVVPEDATALRFRTNLAGYVVVQGYAAPPTFFCGDTPEDEHYTYSWAGTPNDSHSIRTPK